MKATSVLVGAALGLALALPLQQSASAVPVRNFLGSPAATQSVDFLVHLPLRNSDELDALIALQTDPSSQVYHHWLTPAQFRARYGPAPQSVKRAVLALQQRGLSVTRIDSQLIHVRGTAAAVERAFGIQLGIMRDANGTLSTVSRDGTLRVPAELAQLDATVAGLQRTLEPTSNAVNLGPIRNNRFRKFAALWFDDMKQAYKYPSYSVVNGAGWTIAIVGLSDASQADYLAYFNHELVGTGAGELAPLPTLNHTILPGGLPFNPSTGISFEANLDVQQSAGSAPGATVHIYSTPAAGEGFLYAYSIIVDFNSADIVSTSYGGCELGFTREYNHGTDFTRILRSYHDMFRQGNVQGITFLFSSGDTAGSACPPPGYFNKPGQGRQYRARPSVQFWANDPAVTAVGGTNLGTTAPPSPQPSPRVLTSKYVSENAIRDVWGPVDLFGTGNTYFVDWGSGGGTSVLWAEPNYQKTVAPGASGRLVPDVSMQMGGCPGGAIRCHLQTESASVEAFGGSLVGAIGTSSAAPEFAGLLAVTEQAMHTRLGNVNPYIYSLALNNSAGPFYHQGMPADNGIIKVPRGQTGYNVIVGVGTPYARDFAGLRRAIVAGDPQTASNP